MQAQSQKCPRNESQWCNVLALALLMFPQVSLALCSSSASIVDRPPILSSPPAQVGLDSTNDYKRKIFIRSVDWCGSRGMVPLQHYYGAPLERNKRRQKFRHFHSSLSTTKEQRLAKKLEAESRASQPLDPKDLHILYQDGDICVVNKPSGILCVPGPRRNPSLANLVHSALNVEIDIDKTVVHRLDMDTWGIVVFALTENALKTLHQDFRHRRVKKTYQALVCGHLNSSEVEIDLALERDPNHAPFMRVASQQTTVEAHSPAVRKFLNQAPKPSLTQARVLSWEYLDGGLPVTRLQLYPHTGRTHQLRVHCAAIGHPIVGDDIYGYAGEGAPHGGLDRVSESASLSLQKEIHQLEMPLCLHAQQLCLHHPKTRAPMVFEATAPF